MNVWGEWQFSSESECRLKEIFLKFDAEIQSQISFDWLALLNQNSTSPVLCHSEVDINADEEEIFNLIKETLQSDINLSEATFIGISVCSLSRIFLKVKSFLDEFKFCSFCKYITSWNNDLLVEHSMRSVVLSKLQETTEASGLVTFSIKELAISKPDQLCRNVFIPLLSEKNFNDVELLKAVFTVWPAPQKDLIILNYTKKPEFIVNDWLLLHPLIKDLSQTSLLSLLDCIQKFSHKFTKSQIFGRFLVNFCKNLDFIGNREILQEVIEKHQTLFKTQAIKYLDLV